MQKSPEKVDLSEKATFEGWSDHRRFVDFWHRLTKTARGTPYIPSGADVKNLKRILAMTDENGQPVVTESQLEQIGLFFLADFRFQNLAPTISVFLSGSVLTGLLNTMAKDASFWQKLNGYAERYLQRQAEGKAASFRAKVQELINKAVIPN